ncbi:MAG: helix-turn-helix transcriptional regulator [Eggerthellaceae bacterium]|nr:helix-turn-helix transcriptional regulator [Eggerthellaceae bacterium]MBQ3342687.1 helix-turn-helix transcriptional regulator [Kiritimatiellia bacterium]
MAGNIAELANNIRAERHRRRMTQAEVAQIIGVKEETVSNYECAKTQPNYEMAVKLADLFGVTLDELGGREFRREEG